VDRDHRLPASIEWPNDGLEVTNVDGEVWIVTPSDAFVFDGEDAFELGGAIQDVALEAVDNE